MANSVLTKGKYVEFSDDGVVSKELSVDVMYCIGEDKVSNRVIQISLPDVKPGLNASVNIMPNKLIKIINNGNKELAKK
jgi:hypothetical protein